MLRTGAAEKAVPVFPATSSFAAGTLAPETAWSLLFSSVKLPNAAKALIRQVAAKYDAEITVLEIMPDQVHLHFVKWLHPAFIASKNIKGVSSHSLRQEFPALKSRLPLRGHTASSFPQWVELARPRCR